MKKKTAKLLQQAIRISRKGKRLEAYDICTKILATDPCHGPTLHIYGLLRWDAGDLDDARDLLKRATEADPSNSEYWETLGSIFGMLIQDDAALTAFQRAILLDPRNTKAVRHLGRTYLSKGLYKEAAETFVKVTQSKPKQGESWFDLGSALEELKHFDDAIECLSRAVKLEPKNVDFLMRKAHLHLDHGDPIEAEKIYQRVTIIAPTNHVAKAALKAIHQQKSNSFKIDPADKATSLGLSGLQIGDNEGVAIGIEPGLSVDESMGLTLDL
jgi:predicted Zn-dependent protease